MKLNFLVFLIRGVKARTVWNETGIFWSVLFIKTTIRHWFTDERLNERDLLAMIILACDLRRIRRKHADALRDRARLNAIPEDARANSNIFCENDFRQVVHFLKNLTINFSWQDLFSSFLR
jgi:hypothetical protein